MFYLICNSLEERAKLIAHLKENGIQAVFHYLSLHKSDYYKDKHDGRELINCEKFTDCLLRLPLFYELKQEEVKYICDILLGYNARYALYENYPDT
jgi:dTDP-4-amino-4,6-dideoxygalactose transaminase